MTSGRPTFGELLAAAYDHLAAAAAQPGSVTPGRDVDDLTGGIASFVTTLSRYTADLTRTIGHLPDEQLSRLGPWDRAAIRAHDALTSATDALAREPRTDADHAASRSARHLYAAAASLGAGRDLLQGHFSAEPSGARRHESGWSLAITSPTVSRALLTEVGSLALRTSGLITAVTSDTGHHSMRSRLNTARYWLTQPDVCVQLAERGEPSAAAGREVLQAVPANIMPDRRTPENVERVSELLEAVVTTAERARRAAWAANRVDASSPAISVTSWYRIAAASTVTSHHCHLLYTTLAQRIAEDNRGAVRTDLVSAAANAGHARELWLDSAREFQEITTDIRAHISPAALEAADLAIWTGKLAYANPSWTLASGPSQSVRGAKSLAPRLADILDVVGAIHEASDALNGLALANLEQARQAVRARRVLVPTRSLPERHDVPAPFAQPPDSCVTSLIACCQDTAHAAAQAACSGADIAARIGAPSRTLAAARAAARDARPHLSEGASTEARINESEPGVGPIEGTIRSLGVVDQRKLWRASAVDQAGKQLIRDATAEHARRRVARPARGSSVRRPLRAETRTALSPGTQRSQVDGSSAAVRTQLEAEP